MLYDDDYGDQLSNSFQHLVHKNKTIFYAVTSDQILRKRTSPLTKAKAPLCVKPPPCRRVSDQVEAT